MHLNSKRLVFNREGRLAPAKTYVSSVEGLFSVVSINIWHYQAIMQRQAAALRANTAQRSSFQYNWVEKHFLGPEIDHKLLQIVYAFSDTLRVFTFQTFNSQS